MNHAWRRTKGGQRVRVTTRGRKLGNLIKQRCLEVVGFRRAIKKFLVECEGDEDGQCCFDELAISVVPAAFSMERLDREDGHPKIYCAKFHAYEVEGTTEFRMARLQEYGMLADGDGPQICLHIIDRTGVEDVIDSEDLEFFAFADLDLKLCDKAFRQLRRETRRALRTPGKLTAQKWKAAYDALLEMDIVVG